MSPTAGRVAPALSLLLLLASCSRSIFATGVAASPCSQDSDCSTNAYCEIPLSFCSEGGAVVVGEGVCHRNCRSNACTCSSDDDCPGSACSQGRCGISPKCPVEQCPAGCPQARLEETPCGVCLCQSCPGADGGSSDGGEPDGGDSDAGSADAGSAASCGDAGTCDADEFCFAVTDCGGVPLEDAGGVGGCRPPAYSCQAPGMCSQNPTCGCFQQDNPCQGSQLCSVDGGVVSCQFDFP